jgi:hypothetical protein
MKLNPQWCFVCTFYSMARPVVSLKVGQNPGQLLGLGTTDSPLMFGPPWNPILVTEKMFSRGIIILCLCLRSLVLIFLFVIY